MKTALQLADLALFNVVVPVCAWFLLCTVQRTPHCIDDIVLIYFALGMTPYLC